MTGTTVGDVTAPEAVAAPDAAVAVRRPFRLGVYVKAELLRSRRNKRRVLFTIVLPAAFYLIFSQSDAKVTGLTFQAFYMVSMATYGTMNALFSAGAVIALERSTGWNRQLRLTGLHGHEYVVTKVFVAYVTALPGVVVVFVLGATTGHVRLSTGDWLGAGLSILLAALPIAALGVLAGYLARPEVVQPLLGLGSAFLAIIGGIWFPITHGGLLVVAKCLPPYWAARAGRDVLTGGWLGWTGVIAVVGWSVVLAGAAGVAYRRDNLRA